MRLIFAVKIKLLIFWVMISCRDVVRIPTSPWRWRQNSPPKLQYPTTSLQGPTTQKTMTKAELS